MFFSEFWNKFGIFIELDIYNLFDTILLIWILFKFSKELLTIWFILLSIKLLF